MRILEISSPRSLKEIMRDIKVDPYGIKIMAPKAMMHLIRLSAVTNIAANILKQEMLSLGGDAAIARNALTGRSRKTDCLLIGSLAQFLRLQQKLKVQPFGLSEVARDLSKSIASYRKEKFVLQSGAHRLYLGAKPKIMGIINVTPDSFSGDGQYHSSVENIVEAAEEMVCEGADMIDVGGESTRPGARPVSCKEEINRTIPVVKALSKILRVPLSIDTYKPEVARRALDNGAAIVNDITGLRNPFMARIVSRYRAGVVVMHMKGRSPRTMQRKPVYASVIGEIISFLQKAVRVALENKISEEQIIIDPGIGFGKTCKHNLEILRSLKEFKILGRPILVGPSRKSFIGQILGVECNQRVSGTVAACVIAAAHGAHILRVHDVKAVRQALKVSSAISNNRG